MSKEFSYGARQLEIPAIDEIDDYYTHNIPFYRDIYTAVYEYIEEGEICVQIDVDRVQDLLELDLERLISESSIRFNKGIGEASTSVNPNRQRWMGQLAIRKFLEKHYKFKGFFGNMCEDVKPSIKHAEWLMGESGSKDNFTEIKKTMDESFSSSWTRDKDLYERQSGVTTLGNQSETLVEIALESLLDERNFFRVNRRGSMSTYGDFVLMCLPNNLWISCKSGYNKERLMASGYDTDIIGVTFLRDSRELKSQPFIKNYQKVGFLAIYVPEIPVDSKQYELQTSTYTELKSHYGSEGFPRNINGNPFIRPLSGMSVDLGALLDEQDLSKRNTSSF